VGLTTLPYKKENCSEASKKFSWILWRRSRLKLSCGAKERRRGVCIMTLEVGKHRTYPYDFVLTK
jgi:hypothetical protein